jgi:hypothetical protein
MYVNQTIAIKARDLWDLARTPIKKTVLKERLQLYPDRDDANFLLDGFCSGFKLNYCGPRIPVLSDNLTSARQNKSILSEKLFEEKYLGRIIGPFPSPPISNLRINPVGLIPKNSGGWRLITNLSHPTGSSVNEFISPEYSKVQYSQFDNAINMVHKLGTGAYMAKADIKSAFNLCPVWPGDFNLLGIKSDEGYWLQKTLPQGASCSCFIFEKFSKFIQWSTQQESGSQNIDHLLDDFFMVESSVNDCLHLMSSFNHVCQNLGVPLCEEKWVGPTQCLTYLGLEIDSKNQMIRVPIEKIRKAISQLQPLVKNPKKITLKQLQSVVGLLGFVSKAIPAGRAFLRRFYDAMSYAKKPHHFIRISKNMREDASTWLQFLEKFNGTCIFSDLDWLQDDTLELFTDASGNSNLGCGCYFHGSWAVFKWPSHWKNHIFKDITYLELVPIIISFFLWGGDMRNKKVLLRSDNHALVEIINKKSSKNKNIMHLIRKLVLILLQQNIQVKCKHIPGKQNTIADSISRFQWGKLFKSLPLEAALEPCQIPCECLELFKPR